jgi:hypothetical protein
VHDVDYSLVALELPIGNSLVHNFRRYLDSDQSNVWTMAVSPHQQERLQNYVPIARRS